MPTTTITIDEHHEGPGYVLNHRQDGVSWGTDGRVFTSWREAREAAELYRYAAKVERKMKIDAGYEETKKATEEKAEAEAKAAEKAEAKKAAPKKKSTTKKGK